MGDRHVYPHDRNMVHDPGLSIREHAAISMRVPMSGDPELDAMIREARRWDMATAAHQGLLAGGMNIHDIAVSKIALQQADYLLDRLTHPEGGAK